MGIVRYADILDGDVLDVETDGDVVDVESDGDVLDVDEDFRRCCRWLDGDVEYVFAGHVT